MEKEDNDDEKEIAPDECQDCGGYALSGNLCFQCYDWRHEFYGTYEEDD